MCAGRPSDEADYILIVRQAFNHKASAKYNNVNGQWLTHSVAPVMCCYAQQNNNLKVQLL
jgi:hypothetical protein